MDAKTHAARPLGRTRSNRDESRALPVNKNLSIELTVDEILSDLLYPARSIGKPR